MAAVRFRSDLSPKTSKQLNQNLMTSSERIDRIAHLCSSLPPANDQTKPQIEKQHMYVMPCSTLTQLRHSDLFVGCTNLQTQGKCCHNCASISFLSKNIFVPKLTHFDGIVWMKEYLKQIMSKTCNAGAKQIESIFIINTTVSTWRKKMKPFMSLSSSFVSGKIV